MRIGNTIYLDHQATTPLDSQVLGKMLPFFGSSFGNPHSAEHALGWASSRAVEDSRAQIGAMIRADADEIVFTSGATEANNLGLLGLAASAPARKRREILIGLADHKSMLAIGRVLQDRGFAVAHLRVDSNGHLDLEDLLTKISPAVLVVSICLVNSEVGTIQNLSQIHAITREHGVLLHCDAAQAPCAMDISGVSDMADLMSLSAHKMYGPKGIGALYVRRELQGFIEPIIHGGGQQSNLRSGTLPTPLCVGFGAAAELIARPDASEERARIRRQRDLFLSCLFGLPWSIASNGMHGDSRHPGNANVQFAGFSGSNLLGVLQPHLAASTGSACTSGIPEPSHVLRAIGLTNEQASASVRFCIGRHTTDLDIYNAVELISVALVRMSREGLRQTG
jgi:cysteine desulfurase